MIADKLRKSVLQAAIQGKLTDRRPGDGDARDLLAEIAAEKARLVKEGKLRRAAPLPPVGEDEAPFEIPEGWCWVRANEITKEIGDGIHGTPEFSPSGDYYFINGSNLLDSKIIINDNTKRVSLPEYEKYKRNLETTTILLSINGTIGNVAYYNDEPIILGKSACYLTLTEHICKGYIRLILSTQFFFRYAFKAATQTTIKNVSLKAVRTLPIPLPPLAEQRRIVARLEELLPLIDGLAQAEKELEAIERAFPDALRKALLQAAIQGKLTDRRPGDGDARDLLAGIAAEKARLVKEGVIRRAAPLPPVGEDETPFDIPEGWRWVRLGELTRVIGGVSYEKGDVSKSGLRILRGGNIQDRDMKVFINDDDVFLPEKYNSPEKNIRLGDVLIVASTGSKTVIGKAGYVDRAIPNTMIGAFLRICRPYLLSLAGYLRCIFNSELYRGTIRSLAQGTNINNVKEAYITHLTVPLPPLAEQRRIVARLEELLPLIDELAEMEKELSTL